MAESSEKTEEASPRQIDKARQRGEVAQSRDLTGALVLTTGFVVLASHAPEIGTGLKEIIRCCFLTAVSGNLSEAVLLTIFGRVCLEGLQLLLPALLAMMVVAFFVPFLQVGALFSLEPLMPQLSRINPLSGIERQFFTARTYVELLKAAAKVIITTWLCWGVIAGAFVRILLVGRLPPATIARLGGQMVRDCIIRVLLFYVGLSVLDLFYQRWQHGRQLRMTKHEVREESKEQEGDPHHRAHRKRMHEEIASENMFQSVRKASVIVSNPDHIACALRYDPEQEDAPRLLAKGQGHIAERIKQIAKEEDIPIVRDVSLAHALYQMDLDSQIPDELFDAVGEVLKWVELVAKSEGQVPIWRRPPTEPEAG